MKVSRERISGYYEKITIVMNLLLWYSSRWL